VIDEIGDYLFHLIFYNEGEPLLDPDLPYFVRRARGKEIWTEMHTNLSLPISEKKVEELPLSGIDSIIASIDGFTQET
jgi:MoaA/NifB/PqqE/SkfB family radical SAM enzyme